MLSAYEQICSTVTQFTGIIPYLHTLGYRQGFMHCQEISITLCIYPLQMELYTTEKNRTSCALHTLCFCIYVLLAIYYVHVYFL